MSAPSTRPRPTRAEIDLGAVAHNVRILATAAGDARVYAVIKADAYGHGAVAVAHHLERQQLIAGFAVHLVEEGLALRDAGIRAPIMVLGATLGDAHAELVARDLLPVVSSEAELSRFAAVAAARGAPVDVHLKLDTGMSRLGIAPDRLGAIVGSLPAGVRVTGLATHLACADTDPIDAPDSSTRRQLRAFDDARAVAAAAGIAPADIHAANSAATLRFADARYTLVRPGLAIYGNGGYAPRTPALRQAMRVCTEVVQLRHVRAGASVSYNALWTAPAPARIATLPIGYADGYPRRLGNRAEVLVHGQRAPVVGAVCMDMSMVDVTAIRPHVDVGDEVVLLGPQGDDTITTAELARHAGVTEYEVTCAVSRRVPRASV